MLSARKLSPPLKAALLRARSVYANTDQLYGAILSYEGKPGDYQIRYIDTLKRELADVTKEFEQLLASELPALNESLRAKGQQPIPVPPAKLSLMRLRLLREEP